MEFLLMLLFFGCGFGLVGMLIGSEAKYGVQGFWWGFCLGPIGWVIAAILAGQKRQEERARKQEEREVLRWHIHRQQQQAPVTAGYAADEGYEEGPPVPREGRRVGPTNAPVQMARGERLLGVWTEREVQQFVWEGRLMPEDLWYDQAADAWYPLTEHPRITV